MASLHCLFPSFPSGFGGAQQAEQVVAAAALQIPADAGSGGFGWCWL